MPDLCVGAVAVRDDALLMIRRGRPPGQGRWSLPGGRLEHGETVAEAVLRELEEETGLTGLCGPLLGWIELLGDDQTDDHYVVLDFIVTIVDDGDPRAGDDASEVAWVPIWQVPELDLTDGLAEFLADHEIIELLA